MSGLMKDFFDRTYYAALDRHQRPALCGMVCAGSDGQGAVAAARAHRAPAGG